MHGPMPVAPIDRRGSENARSSVRGAAVIAAVAALAAIASAAPPDGFVVEPVGGNWSGIAGVEFLEDGRAIAWERGGTLWMIDADGHRHDEPMLDIHEEVGAWRDHGLLGVAVDPHYLENGRIFLLYVVDRHHLLFAGTPQYDPRADWPFAASIGRITRYTATPESGFSQIDPASRTILLGESASTGIPIVHQSHGVGTILVGDDHTLLVSAGDSASYEETDLGGAMPGGYAPQALADGILAPKEDIGAFRAQLVDCLNGKILRLDPETGDGVPSNPFFDPGAPRAARSRVWCLGLRNPFRMELIPHSGSHDPEDGRPGTLVIGDVGWYTREEINVADGPAVDFGWPIFEGLDWMDAYALSSVPNPDAPNPLAPAPVSSCVAPNFLFRDLLLRETIDPAPIAPNPCGLYQAESTGSSTMPVSTVEPGFTGSSARRQVLPGGGSGWVQWAVGIASAGPKELWFRVSSVAPAPATLQVSVDGTPTGSPVSVPPTTDPSHYRWVVATLDLPAGNHTLRATITAAASPSGSTEVRMDAMAIVAPGSTPALVPEPMHTFVHRRPVIDWRHSAAVASVPSFDGDIPTAPVIGTPASGVDGAPFAGSCAISGGVIESRRWPEAWHGMHLMSDFAHAWIRGVQLDAEHRVTEVLPFDDAAGSVIGARYNPHDDSLWVIRWEDELVRIRFDPAASGAPVIVATVTPTWGPSPLTVSLDASRSFDPEGTPLVITWNFSDHEPPVRGAVGEHTFQGAGPASHSVTVTARDQTGLESSLVIPVWTDNTPPSVAITSLYDGQPYPMDSKWLAPLEAAISDAEQSDLDCAWTTILHHNTHQHSEPADPACATSTLITPLGCGDETYWHEIRLVVADPLGLSTTRTVSLLPDCLGWLLCPADLDHDGRVDGADLGTLLGAWGATGAGPADLDHDGVVDGSDLGELLGWWGACPR